MNCPKLTTRDYKAVGYWPVVLQRKVAAVHEDLGAIYRFYSGHQLLGHHEGGTTMLQKGFACDGYSPVIRIPWGKGRYRFIKLTHTPKSAGLFPAVWHDFTRQFSYVDGCPWARDQTDWWFYDSLVKGGVNPHIAGTYYGAVAGLAGDVFIRMSRKPDPLLWIEKIQYA